MGKGMRTMSMKKTNNKDGEIPRQPLFCKNSINK